MSLGQTRECEERVVVRERLRERERERRRGSVRVSRRACVDIRPRDPCRPTDSSLHAHYRTRRASIGILADPSACNSRSADVGRGCCSSDPATSPACWQQAALLSLVSSSQLPSLIKLQQSIPFRALKHSYKPTCLRMQILSRIRDSVASSAKLKTMHLKPTWISCRAKTETPVADQPSLDSVIHVQKGSLTISGALAASVITRHCPASATESL